MYMVSVGKPHGMRPLESSKRKGEDSIKTDHEYVCCNNVNLIWVLGFGSRRGLGIFLSTTASRTALRLTQPPNQWVPEALSLGTKRPGREVDHSSLVKE
jgi:hypothetical protein